MESIRNKLGWGLSGALALLLLAALAGVVHGGPLDPPGPPGSTGKNVITSLPFFIDQPGSYVLNGNLNGVNGQSGIVVTANNVTIDLQGFELVGVPGSLHGIGHTSGSLSGLTARNGTIRNWPQLGISSGPSLLVDGVSFKGNNGGVIASDGATLTNCRVEGSVGSGVILGNRAVVSNCTSDSNGPGCTTCPGIQVGWDSTITESVARNNGGNEIDAGVGSTVENCTADGNGTSGIGILMAPNGTVRGCTAMNNGGDEIQAAGPSVVRDCVANGFGTAGSGIFVGQSSTVSNCTARNNGGFEEIYVNDRSLVENCVADGWTGSARGSGDGIRVGTASIVRGCTVENNAGSGIIVSGPNHRIEGNHVQANSIYGIAAGDSSDVVLQNDSKLNGSGTVSANCTDAGADFVKVTTPAGAGAFDNICD